MIQKRTELDRYIIHWLSPCNTKNKHQNPKTNQNKTPTIKQINQIQEQGTSRQVDSCSVHGQLEDARRDDNIVSPQDWVCQSKTKAKNRQQSAIQQSVSQEATKAQCGNQGSRSQEPRDHRVQAARATFSQIHGYDPKPARRCLVASGKTFKSETWCESGAKVKRQRN